MESTGTLYYTTTFNLSKVKDFERVCYNSDKKDILLTTSAIIWITVEVGMPKLTRKNLDEFAARVFLYQCAHNSSAMWNKNIKAWEWITYKHIQQHVGLETNAQKKTRVQYMKELERHVLRRYTPLNKGEWNRVYNNSAH